MYINGATLNNSDSGKVLSNTALALKVGQIINQTAGQIVSKGAVTLSGVGLDNSGGKIVSQNNLALTFDGIKNNQQGLVSSEGTLVLRLLTSPLLLFSRPTLPVRRSVLLITPLVLNI